MDIICRLILPDGSGLPLDEGGVLIGRSAICHVVLRDPRVSKRHALIRLGHAGPELIPLGRYPIYLNDEPVTIPGPLMWGDRLDLPGARILVEGSGPLAADQSCWVVSGQDGTVVSPHRASWSLGGGPEDWLRVPGCSPAALCMRQLQGGLIGELNEAVEVNGEPHEAGEVLQIIVGDEIRLNGRTFTFQIEGAGTDATVMSATEGGAPIGVEFEFLPEGGELHLDFGTSRSTVRLSELRARLIAVLLSPPGDHVAGDLISDELLLRGIWPGQLDKNSTHLNVLLHRVRSDLTSQNLNPFRVLDRPRGVASLRFKLAAGAEVVVR